MKAFVKHTGVVAPMDLANVDTDMIIPKQFLKAINRSGFGPYLFDEMRYLDAGWYGKPASERRLNPDFALNQQRYQNASILLARENFGCGSSREHAPWALDDYGFRVIIAPSYADIFYNNCFKNGILPVVLDKTIVDQLFREQAVEPGYCLTVDLESQTITKPSGAAIAFDIDGFRKHCLLEGLDEIGLTLQSAQLIREFEAKHTRAFPWLYGAIK